MSKKTNMDIIIFAAIAIFIFFKLRSQFGKVDEEQKREAIKRFLREQERAAANHGKKDFQTQELDGQKMEIIVSEEDNKKEAQNSEILDVLDSGLKESLIEVLAKSKISAADFMHGANIAFEMVISAFSKGDKQILQKLLSEDLFNKFIAAIDDRNELNRTLYANVIALNKSIIKDARIENNNAVIVVNFVSKQISYTTNQEGEIVEGSKEKLNEVSDIWTFSRDIKSKNPNWTIISTKS